MSAVPALPFTGGQGVDPHHKRADAMMIERALREGWLTPWIVKGEAYRELPNQVYDALCVAGAAGDIKSVSRLAMCLKGFSDHNLRLAEVVDKSQRLDSGLATENVKQTHTVSFDAQG